VVDRIDESSIISRLLSAKTYKYVVLTSPAPLDYSGCSKIKTSFIGRYAVVGLGFSIAKRCRKPVISCLCEGAILKVNDKDGGKDREDVFRYGLYGLLSTAKEHYKIMGRLGFASFIPLDAPLE